MIKIIFKSEGGQYTFISKHNNEHKALKELARRFTKSGQHLYRVRYCEPINENDYALGGAQ